MALPDALVWVISVLAIPFLSLLVPFCMDTDLIRIKFSIVILVPRNWHRCDSIDGNYTCFDMLPTS